MKKEVAVILIFLIFISAGAFAETVSNGAVSQEISSYVESFIQGQGIAKNEIKEIKKIDQSNLPDEVDIKKIDENKVGIYEVNYTQNNASKKIFVVTYSTEQFKKEEISSKNIQYLNFGYSGASSGSGYLKSATGVVTSQNNGYVMMRKGSVTGISTSMGIGGTGKVIISVYKNGQDTGFSNVIEQNDAEKIDYDLQSENVVTYDAGDIISVYIESIGDVQWSDIITMVETTS